MCFTSKLKNLNIINTLNVFLVVEFVSRVKKYAQNVYMDMFRTK